jgi:large subunit ribosomal protein L31e
MAIERTYTIPLRRAFLKAPRYKRAKRAISEVAYFLEKHMKVTPENLSIGKYLNKEVWKHGMRNPPSRVRVNVKKDEKGMVFAELVGAPVEIKKEEKKKEVKKEDAKKEAPKAEIKTAGKAEEKEGHKVEHKQVHAVSPKSSEAAVKGLGGRKIDNPSVRK